MPVAHAASDAVAVCHWDRSAGDGTTAPIEGRSTSPPDARDVALVFAYGEPLVLPSRAASEARVERHGPVLAGVDRLAHVRRPDGRDAVCAARSR